MLRRCFVFAVGVLAISCEVQAGELVERIEVTLPDKFHTDWYQATDKEADGRYLKEWIPKGRNFESTDWLIVSSKNPIDRQAPAEAYLKALMASFKQHCSDVLYNGPEEIEVGALITATGRTFCAKQNGRSYGVVTEHRVIVDGYNLYLVISELRFPPTTKAGNFEFPDETAKDDAAELMAKLVTSSQVVRDGVKICLVGDDSC